MVEYFNAVGVDTMLEIFASMLHERRIVMTSSKLNVLSACIQAANSLIYPMFWQHILIPILPKQMMDYLQVRSMLKKIFSVLPWRYGNALDLCLSLV